jgi:PPOX class probable F420-dependent enzyme
MASTTTRTTTLTEAQGRFLQEPNYAVVAALRADGTPHQTVVWVDWDGEHVLVNTTAERAKLGYLEDDPSVSVLVLDRNDPYRWLSISGRVDEITPNGAEEQIHHLARVYRGEDRYPLQQGERRLLVRIAPRRVTDYGVDSTG